MRNFETAFVIGAANLVFLAFVSCGARTALDSEALSRNSNGGATSPVSTNAAATGGAYASAGGTGLSLGGSMHTDGTGVGGNDLPTGGRDAVGGWPAGSGGTRTTGGATAVFAGATATGGAPAVSGGQASTTACVNRPAKSERESLIDDLESGSGRLPSAENRVGVWYAFNDEPEFGLQTPQPTTPGVPILPSEIPAGQTQFASCGSNLAMHTYGGNCRWVGIGFDLNFDGTKYGTYDASAFDGITWYAAGKTSGDFSVRVSTRSTTSTRYGGTCTLDDTHLTNEGCQPHSSAASLDSDFAQHWVPFNALAPFYYGEPGTADATFERHLLTNVQFYTAGDFDFWIDDVRFYQGQPGCCAISPPECNGTIQFSNPRLKSLIGTGDLTCANVCYLESVYDWETATPDAPQSLDGMQCLVGLRRLSVNNAFTNDIRAIAGLEWLQQLRLTNNSITNLEPLARMKRLRELGLSNNAIEDIRPLASLTALQTLDLAYNSVTDVSALRSLTELQSLALSENHVTDVTPLSNLVNLLTLHLQGNSIKTLAGFGQLPKVPTLDLSNNQIGDLAHFGDMASLTTLNLSHNSIVSAAFGKLPALQNLDLSNNQVSDLTQFGDLPALTTVNLSHNRIRNLMTAGGLEKLVKVDLSDNLVTELSDIASLDTITTLYLSNNSISDIEILGQLPLLTALTLANNDIHDVSALTGLHQIQYLDLRDNDITDLAVFLAFSWAPSRPGDRYITEYSTLRLEGNPIDCVEQAANLEALRSYDLDVTSDCTGD